MKTRTLFLFLVIVCGVGFFLLQGHLKKSSKERLASTMTETGFKNTKISDVDMSMGSVTFNDITFDEDGFGHIDSITQNLSWIKNIFSQNTDSTIINKITLNAVSEDFSVFQLPSMLTYLQNGIMNLNHVTLNLLQFNLATENIGDLRIEAKLSAQTNEDGEKSVQAVTWARQYQLGFELPLSGIIQKDRSYLFESTFNDGKFNAGPLRLSRMNGWMSVHGDKGLLKTAALQLDTGSADLFSLPLQKINIAYSQSAKTANGILRANITGLPDTTVALDYNKTPQSEQGVIFIDLPTAKDTKGFWSRVLENSAKSESTLTRLADTGLSMTLTYQPERRFAGGPIPFSFIVKDISKNTHRSILQGNLLIYMDSLNLKGTVFGDAEAIRDLKTLFSITEDTDDNENLRFDFSFASMLKQAVLKGSE